VDIVTKLQKVEESTWVPTTFKPSWPIKWVSLLYVVDHLEIILSNVTSEVKEELGKQILDNKIIVTIRQSL
jgi:hypothetical protein